MTDEINSEERDEAVESERLSRLAAAPPPAGERTEDAVVEEYEERYRAPRPPKAKRKPKAIPRSYSTMRVSNDEKMWVTVAHASVWITFLMGFATAGFGVPLTIFIPLVIYLMYRKQSDYVAFHALQAFVLQLIGTVGVLTLAVVGSIVWVIGLIIAVILMIALVGFILVPVWGIVGIGLLLMIILGPFAMLAFGTIGAVKTWNKQDYRYPFIARWVDRQLADGFLN